MSWRWVPLPISLRLSSRSSAKMSLRSSNMARIPSGASRGAARGGGENGVDDRLVAGAAADVAGNAVDDVLPRRLWVVGEQRLGRHQHPRRAVAALRGKVFHEGGLQRMQRSTGLEPVGG